MVEVDLDERKYLGWLGDMKARIERERPIGLKERVGQGPDSVRPGKRRKRFP